MGKRRYPRLRDWQHWTEEGLDELDAYLTGLISQADLGSKQAKLALRYQEEDWLVEQEAYWRNVASGLRWLRGSLRRQRRCKQERAQRGATDTV